ncbi:RluA family pseudouridine synthase [Anaerovorax odorimutans]|uniref:Pseudouridine synthase n=1 Tax=Anaerovorax odorimutans TaxID=109327 RepID=A0ABT1RLE8_9FIRM|nr:RluA family pseudouridine synthase [Anaerovorax odorimutans]MCQ4635993.1 RluA family pseudouridine synthase [Anaerovorax odorimutans]
MSQFKYIVTEEDKDLDVKGVLRHKFDFSARTRGKIKREKLVYLNGEQTAGWLPVKTGDVITIEFPRETSNFIPEDIPISIVYEDDSLLIVNKQPGLVVHPTKGHSNHTLANGIMKYMLDSGQNYKIRFMNRLDMDTSGLVAVAKNSHCQASFMKQSQAGLVEKRYLAIVKGLVESDTGTIDLPVGQPDPERVERAVVEGGAPSLTHYKVVERFRAGFSLVELALETGRTHQIRVHMAHIGYPIVSDHLYGETNPFLIERQALHAFRLGLSHPVTGKPVTFEAPLPQDMETLLEKLR